MKKRVFPMFSVRFAATFVCAVMLLGFAFAEPSPNRAFFVKWADSGNNKSLRGVHFADARTGWAVGEGGTIVATRDGGTSWLAQVSGTDKYLRGVHFADARTGWAVGESGTIVATRDGGASWSAQVSGTTTNLLGVHFADARTGWAVGSGGTIVATRDGGASWLAQVSGTTRDLFGVHFADARTGWAVGESGTIVATRDGGASWLAQVSGTIQALLGAHFADARTGWAVGVGGTIVATRDGGASWSAQVSRTTEHLWGMHFADARTGWAVGENGTIVATPDGGASWSPQQSGTTKDLVGVHFADARTGWAVGEDGTIVATRDGGASWSAQGSGTTNNLWGVHFADARTGWAVGDGGTIVATRDGGATWSAQVSGTTKNLWGVHFADTRTGWAVGENGTIVATPDGGASWSPQQSGTTKDLVGVHFADARTGWAVGEDGTIVATGDGGASWSAQVSGTTKDLRGVHFADVRTGWAVGMGGTIVATGDGGASWSAQGSGTTKYLLGAHFADARTGWAVGAGGTIVATRDGGATWSKQQSRTTRGLGGVHFADARTGWAVGTGGTIVATRDGGTRWSAQVSGTTSNLGGVHFADARTGWAVGEGGTMLRSGPPIYAPFIDANDVKVVSKNLGELDVSFPVNTEGSADVIKASVLARVRQAQWTQIGTATKSDPRDGRWHVTWKPETIANPGDTIDYQVQLDDGGPPLAAVPLGKFAYDPWWARVWRDNKSAVTGGFAGLGILLIYVGAFGLILLFAPARLALVGSAAGLDSVVKPTGNVAFVWDIARRIFEHATLPWLCRHPRVRHAWTALYRNGKAKLDDLGKPVRSSFLLEPEVLDAWVARSVSKIESALQQLDLFTQRQVYVPSAVRIGQAGPLIERPSAGALRPMFARDRAVVSIVGPGGTGKSTLACALARWAIANDPSERLVPHRMLPVFVVQETTNLVETVTQELRRMLGAEGLPDDLVRGLLTKQRLLVIVDALSERDPETQQHVQNIFAQDVPLNAVVITSRTEPNLGALDRTALYPVRLDAASIVPFIIGYLDRMTAAGQADENSRTADLDRMKAVSQLRDGRVQLQLGERILTLAESGGQKTPVTPLLVTLFVESALRRAADGLSFDEMPEAVPEVFVDYLRRLNSGGARPDGPLSDDLFIRAAQTIASVSLGTNLIPQDFSPQDATEALKQDAGNDQQAAFLLSRLVASGVVERRSPGGQVVLRFSLDPVAEYLAAIRRLFSMKAASGEEWRAYLSSLEKTIGYPKGPEGYLIALTTCYKAYKKDYSLPEVLFPWEEAAAMSAPDSAISNAVKSTTTRRKRSPRAKS
jgi:photosystem II stability/assembly factor-like uncharacterized protein